MYHMQNSFHQIFFQLHLHGFFIKTKNEYFLSTSSLRMRRHQIQQKMHILHIIEISLKWCFPWPLEPFNIHQSGYNPVQPALLLLLTVILTMSMPSHNTLLNKSLSAVHCFIKQNINFILVGLLLSIWMRIVNFVNSYWNWLTKL